MSKTSIGLSGNVLSYYQAHAYNEPAILADLRSETTAKLGGNAAMQIAPEQGAFMGIIAGAMNARAILEIGTFTGYSSLAMALGSEAHIHAADVSEEWTAIARRYWTKAGVADRITLSLAGGNAVIEGLLGKGRAGSFDICFIDADKSGYDAYYEGALKLLRPGGLVMIDNVLWDGDVADPEKRDADTLALKALNDKIKADRRVSHAMLPLADGLTLARKN